MFVSIVSPPSISLFIKSLIFSLDYFGVFLVVIMIGMVLYSIAQIPVQLEKLNTLWATISTEINKYLSSLAEMLEPCKQGWLKLLFKLGRN
jgi:hypothetical protein